MRLVFKDPRLKKQMFKMFVPFLLQELVITLTTLMSNLILNAWGCDPKVMLGITNAFQVFFVYNVIASGICYVANLFMSQHYGRGAIDEVQIDYYVLLKVSFVLGIIFFILALAIPQYLLWFSTDLEALNYGAEYLRWFSPVFLLIAPSMINYALMKNMRLEKFCTISSIITFVMILAIESSIILSLDEAHYSWALEGAALSMVVGRIVEFLFLFIVINKKCIVKFKFKECFKIYFDRFKSMVYYGSPMVVSKFSWAMGFVMVTIIANKFVNIAAANGLFEAHSVMITYQNIVSCMSNAMASVVAVVIGRELGANRMRKAKDHGTDISRLAMFMGIIQIAAFMLFLPIAIVATPNLSPKAYDYLWKVFLIQCIAIIPRLYNSYYINGLFNAGGDTLFILLVDGITAWATIVPLGYIGINFNWNPLLVYALIQLEENFKVPFVIWRYKTKKWVFNITKKKGIVFNE